MNTLKTLINGNGHAKFAWEVAVIMGNDAQTIAESKTFADALAYKLMHPNKNFIVIELYYNSHKEKEYLGDETNMLKLQENIKKICISKKIDLSL